MLKAPGASLLMHTALSAFVLHAAPTLDGLAPRAWVRRAGLVLSALLLSACATLQGDAPQPAPAAAISSPPAQTGTAAAVQSPAAGAAVDPQASLKAVTGLPGQALAGVAPLEPPRELWDRIRRGYALPDLQNDLVGVHERWYTSRPDYIQRMTERSRKYLFHIVEEIERRGMPTELALLPFIESAFNPQAVSSAKAAGMWQFMPQTGTHFDLKQNAFRDDRRDVLASTRAALDYLQRLHNMFGDWHLALAAYNWGEGNVGRAIARNKRAGLGTGYEDLQMPAETRNYVPKLQAVKNIVGAPASHSAELPFIVNHPYFQEVEISRDIDVALAARLADVKLEDFKALNPSANRPVILAAGTRRILLPWDNAEVFKRNFEAHNSGQYATWTAWTVPSTMSAAEAARRTGMNEAELRSVNNIPPRMLIKAGSALLVPRSSRMNDDVSSHVADNGRIGLAPEVVLRRLTVKARKGETVASLAQRYKASAESVAEWNKVAAGAAFKPGQAVVLYLPGNAPRAVAAKGGASPAKAGSKVAAQRPASQQVARKTAPARPADKKVAQRG